MSTMMWQSCVYSLDGMAADAGELAAYLVTLTRASMAGSPQWVLTSNSDGRNLFGRAIPRVGLAVAWFAGTHSDLHVPHAWPAILSGRTSESWGRRMAREAIGFADAMLRSDAHMPLSAHAARLCSADLEVNDLLHGPHANELADSLVRLHARPNRLRELHAEATRVPYSPGLGSGGGPGAKPDETVPASRTPAEPDALKIATVVADRPECDVVYAYRLPYVEPEGFAAIAPALRALAQEFRRRLWARGGIYASGLKLSFVERTLCWWTSMDSDPLGTRDLIDELTARVPETDGFDPACALGYLPPITPGWLGSSVCRSTELLWGVSSQDIAHVLSDPQPADFRAWLRPEGTRALCVCGRRDRVERLMGNASGVRVAAGAEVAEGPSARATVHA